MYRDIVLIRTGKVTFGVDTVSWVGSGGWHIGGHVQYSNAQGVRTQAQTAANSAVGGADSHSRYSHLGPTSVP